MTGQHREGQPQTPARGHDCRFCGAGLSLSFVDLGSSPLCQKHVPLAQAQEAEAFFPLHAFVCTRCYLVQLDELVVPAEIFADGAYAYFASFSDTWLAHARRYVENVSQRFALGAASFVLEIASNDGYLLQNFVARGVPVLGIEPASNCAAAARAKGIDTRVCFFGAEVARQLLAEGKSNKEIAATLGISIKTAETHRARIMAKLQIHSITELVRYALRNRILLEP